MINGAIPTLSIGIVCGALLLLLVAAFKRRTRASASQVEDQANEYFLMGQAAGPMLLAVSYCATLLSAFTFIGLPGYFYGHGAGTWLFIPFSNIAAVMVFLLFGTFFRSIQARFGTYSPLDVIGLAYGSQRLATLAFCISTVFIVPHIAVQLAGFGRLAAGFGFDYEFSAFILLVVLVLYIIVAGMWGDVWTDVWQAGIMVIGLWVIVAVMLSTHWSGNLSEMFAAVTVERGPGHLSLPGTTGFFTHLALISYVVMFTSVTVVQSPYAMRILIARGEDDLRRASIGLPWLLLAFFVPTFLIGIAGVALYPDLESGDLLMGRVLAAHFGSGGVITAIVLGLVLTGLTFAVLSTVDSQLLAVGATFTKDLYSPLIDPAVSSTRQVRVSRSAMIAVAALAFIVSLNPPRLIIQLSILSVAGTLQLLPMFLAGVLRRNPPSVLSASASVVVGLGTFMGFQWMASPGVLWGVHSGVLGLVAGTAAMVAVEAIHTHGRGALGAGKGGDHRDRASEK